VSRPEHLRKNPPALPSGEPDQPAKAPKPHRKGIPSGAQNKRDHYQRQAQALPVKLSSIFFLTDIPPRAEKPPITAVFLENSAINLKVESSLCVNRSARGYKNHHFLRRLP
jgi:hypothetical protein